MGRVHVYVSGVVQGVWFRVYAKKRADVVGVCGWIRNLADGRVEAVFEGTEDQINEMIAWCYRGSPLSTVEQVHVMHEKSKGEIGFEIVD